MDKTMAERSRRYRRHKRGDHSLCLPERCRDKAREVSVRLPAVRSLPGQGPTPDSRGDVLRRGLSGSTEPSPAAAVLIEEAGRITDRLDRLAEQLDGRAWLRMRTQDIAADMDVTTVNVKVVIDAALSEARQQALALKAILSELSRIAPTGEAPPPEEVNSVANLAARIASRRDKAPG